MTADKGHDPRSSRIMTDGEYEAAVAVFIRTRGITRCPTACVVQTQATIGAADRAALRQRAADSEARRHILPRGGGWISTTPNRGNPNIADAAAKGRAVHKAAADHFAASVRPIIEMIRAAGTTGLAAIADELNSRGIGAPRGGQWRGSAVRRLLARCADEPSA